MGPITLTLKRSKLTQGTVVYDHPDGSAVPFSRLYVRKDALRRPGKGYPDQITVTVVFPPEEDE